MPSASEIHHEGREAEAFACLRSSCKIKKRRTDKAMKNPFAVALGKLAKGVKKSVTPEDRERRRKQMIALNANHPKNDPERKARRNGKKGGRPRKGKRTKPSEADLTGDELPKRRTDPW